MSGKKTPRRRNAAAGRSPEAEVQAFEAAARRRLFEHTYGHLERASAKALKPSEAARDAFVAAGQPVPPDVLRQIEHQKEVLDLFDALRFCRAKNRPDLAIVCATKLGMAMYKTAVADRIELAEKFTRPGRRRGADGPVARSIKSVLRSRGMSADAVLKALGWRDYGDRVEGPKKEIARGTFNNIVSRIKQTLPPK